MTCTNQPELVYVASPYSHDDPSVRQRRFELVAEFAAHLMRDGLFVYSPIAHTHPIAQHGLPLGWDFWEKYDRVMLPRCDRMIVLTLDGWDDSKGVSAEIEIMRAAGKCVEFQEFVEQPA